MLNMGYIGSDEFAAWDGTVVFLLYNALDSEVYVTINGRQTSFPASRPDADHGAAILKACNPVLSRDELNILLSFESISRVREVVEVGNARLKLLKDHIRQTLDDLIFVQHIPLELVELVLSQFKSEG